MKKFTVKWEMELLDAKDPLEAAKQALESMTEGGALMFTVIDEKTLQEYSVDLNEDDEDAVLPIK